MSAYRLRRQGREFLVIDRAALVRMAESGQVRAEDEAWVQDRWVPALTHPDLKKADLWDAWDDAEAAPEAQVLAPFQEPEELEPEPLPDAPKKLVITKKPTAPKAVIVSKAAPPELPTADVEPVDDPPELTSDLGQVIKFPTPKPKLPEFPPNTPRGQNPVVRMSRLVSFGFFGLMGLALVWLWIISQGQTTGVRVAEPDVPKVTAPKTDAHRDLLAGLRGRVPQEVQAVRGPSDLGDAMLVELQNLGTGVESVNATVTKWTGPKGDQPKEATVTVTFSDTENLERDLAGYALVLGRYLRAYPLKIPDARAVFHGPDGDVGRSVNAAMAVDVYSGKVPLQRFLDDEG